MLSACLVVVFVCMTAVWVSCSACGLHRRRHSLIHTPGFTNLLNLCSRFAWTIPSLGSVGEHTLANTRAPKLTTRNSGLLKVKRVTTGVVKSQEIKVTKELRRLQENTEKMSIDKQIDEIVKYLRDNPQLVASAHNHLCGGLLARMSDETDDEDGDEFAVEYKCFSRAPKAWLQTWLQNICPNIDKGAVKLLRSRDPEVLLHLVCRASLQEVGSPFGPKRKSAWTKAYTRRHEEIGSPLRALSWDEVGNIRWQACGVYQLVPPMAAGTDPMSHQYEGLKCGQFVAQFDQVRIDGRWTIEQNWSVKSAYLSSGGRNPMTMPCIGQLPSGELETIAPPMSFDDQPRDSDGLPQHQAICEASPPVAASSTGLVGHRQSPPAQARQAPPPLADSGAANDPAGPGAATMKQEEVPIGISPAKTSRTLPPGVETPPPKAARWVDAALVSIGSR